MKFKQTQLLGKEEVDVYLENLDHPFKAEVELLRSIILSANDQLEERIKWNSPSFYFVKDFAAFNLRAKGYVQIIFIFYDGNIIESEGLLQGKWKDRREARFYSLIDIHNKTSQLKDFVNDWIKL
ncbi:DUF1801 domain-containing protein [Pedobacter fastidiosus]|uniref:DUF1801 domain-containing protein n=1 Tax=Pedobacter fastidiosus TaxID=2765361 RepID=A0ABR7KRV1_9SPHI|nr:DUF1801 domain-containing protein [Pedobacter fastidiosus]MBC6110792.1 DUF1801 domain-containing protein [Pedobacter fastidiosus]